PYTFPKIAIVDPLLTKSMSPNLTADTGFDALSHAVEAYLSVNANPLSDMLAKKAITLIAGSLVEATKNGENLQARANMALASTLAGMAISQAGVVAGHGLGMSIGGILDTPHGRTVGILLPYIMEDNLPEASSKISQLASCFNIPSSGNVADDARKVIDAVKKMIDETALPTRLRDIGVSEKDIPKIAEDCMDRPDMANNPRKFDTERVKEFLKLIL
ncbi:alcohol dehydrogenase, partial [Candidatus Aerophobetes bacterium]